MLFCSSGRKTKSAVEKKNKMDTTRLISFEEKRSIGKIANLLGHHDYEYAQPQHQFFFERNEHRVFPFSINKEVKATEG